MDMCDYSNYTCIPLCFKKVYAIPPPMIIMSTVPRRLSISFILSCTLALRNDGRNKL